MHNAVVILCSCSTRPRQIKLNSLEPYGNSAEADDAFDLIVNATVKINLTASV